MYEIWRVAERKFAYQYAAHSLQEARGWIEHNVPSGVMASRFGTAGAQTIDAEAIEAYSWQPPSGPKVGYSIRRLGR
jgi:hypothetical protein